MKQKVVLELDLLQQLSATLLSLGTIACWGVPLIRGCESFTTFCGGGVNWTPPKKTKYFRTKFSRPKGYYKNVWYYHTLLVRIKAWIQGPWRAPTSKIHKFVVYMYNAHSTGSTWSGICWSVNFIKDFTDLKTIKTGLFIPLSRPPISILVTVPGVKQ